MSHFVVPLLTMNPDDGSISSGIVPGSEKRGIIEMVKRLYLESETRKRQPDKFSIAYTRDEEVGQIVEYYLSRRFDLTESNITPLKEAGSGLAVHAGPRVAILSALWN